MHVETFAYAHILGGLYGQAIGDAWGMPALLRPRQTWDYFGGWLEQFEAPSPDHPVHSGFVAGQVTDDTQQAMILAEKIIEQGQITVPGVAQAMVSWYNQVDGDNSPFVGPSSRRAIQALKAGADPYKSGLRGDTNGGAMRISPVGLIHPGDPESAVRDAVIACTPTHFTDVAVSAACAVAAAIAQAMVPDTTLEDIVNTAVWGAEIGVQEGQPWMGPSVVRKIDFAVQLATDPHQSERDRLQSLYDLVGSTLAAADAVACAFGVLAMSEGDPIQTAIYAAGLSGDADTVGAIACAIAGAWWSIDSIPLEVTQIINQANPEYDFEEIAEGLYDIALKNQSDVPINSAPSLDEILGMTSDED
jgi:ADP-ribosylglycohydrolase